jgi:hypothetical protein
MPAGTPAVTGAPAARLAESLGQPLPASAKPVPAAPNTDRRVSMAYPPSRICYGLALPPERPSCAMILQHRLSEE